jgi:hypothetical protein
MWVRTNSKKERIILYSQLKREILKAQILFYTTLRSF